MPYAHSFFDLEKKYENALRKELNELGVNTSDIPDKDIGIYYHDFAGRVIANKPRTVYLAPGFACPSEHHEGLGNLIKAFQRGGNLAPYRSKGLFKNIKKNDKLFYDWSIHHFHLGNQLTGDGKFVVRTKEVVFAVVVANAAIFLKVADHNANTNPLVWSDIDLMELVLKTAPKLLKQYIVANAVSGNSLTAQQRENLRKGNCNSMTTLSDGKTYWSPGGGFMSNGVSMQASMKDMQIRRDLDYVSRVLYNDHTRAVANFFDKFSRHPKIIELILLKVGDLYFCRTAGSNKSVVAHPQNLLSEPTLTQALQIRLAQLSDSSYSYKS